MKNPYNSTAAKYADIINLPRPVSQTRPHLSTAQRAAQFAPYKTIVAYHDSTTTLEENSEITELEVVLDSSQLAGFDEFYADIMPEDLEFNDNNISAEIINTEDFDVEDIENHTIDLDE